MPTNVQKTLTDAGYIAVGLGVMGYQQAQTHARAACSRVSEAGSAVAGHARGARTTIDTQTSTARTEAETQLRSAVARATAQAKEVRGHVEKRVEPVVGQVQAQLSDLPERVVQAMEPVAARMRELSGNAT